MISAHRVAAALRGLGLISVVLATVPSLFAGDWSQILGPNRNGIADQEQLRDKWPEAGPAFLWEVKIGSGFAGVATFGGIAILFHRQGDNDLLTAFDAASGKELWAHPFPTNFEPQIGDDNGPRAIPTIHSGRIYALAGGGGLYCVDLKTGKPVWERQTQQEFHPPSSYFGAGCSPLVEGKTVIVNVGGDKSGAGIVAFDLETGKTTWKATSEQASYSSPIAVTLEGTRHLLCVTRLNLVSLDPTSGKEQFKTPFGKRGPTVNAAIPIVIKNQVLLTASYGIGAEFVSISGDTVDVEWNDEILSSQYATPILHDGAIYGVDGRQDFGPVTLKCFDPATRQLHWAKALPTYATLIAADGKLIVMQTDGKLKLVELTKTGYRELASASLLNGTTRALPALSQGRFYVRNESKLKCVSVGR